MIVAGIDYSITSPAITVHEGKTWDPNACRFFYFGKKKNIVENSRFTGSLYPEWKTLEERYEALSNWSLEILLSEGVSDVAIEGYAFGAKGRAVFQIAENCGILKWKIWEAELPFEIYPPTQVKKFATDKGNAAKDLMYDAFKKETELNLQELLGTTTWNPVSDIADSYFIAKQHHFVLTDTEKHDTNDQ